MSFTVASHCCVYAECKNTRKTTPKLSFYSFPVNDTARCRIWIVNSGNPKLFDISERKTLQGKVICEYHFLQSSFRDFSAPKKLLNRNAVPIKYISKESMQETTSFPIDRHNITAKNLDKEKIVQGGSSPIRPYSPVTSDDSTMSSGKKWRESDTIKFVELYEKAECLWNFRHPGYKHRNARDKAIQHIIEQMNLPDFGVNELKNKIKNIRSTYQQEVNKIRRSKEGCTDILEEYKTNLAWFPIADRFLGGVINSTKNPLPKTEEEDPSFFQATQPALYNLVETEMINGDLDNEVEEKFTPFPLSIDQIKEEIDNDDYLTSSVTHYSKKRKLSSHQPSAYDGSEYKSEEIETHHHSLADVLQKDEWYHFGNNISCQLRNLPLEVALMCQKKIVDILTQERIDYIMRLKNEGKNNANNE